MKLRTLILLALLAAINGLSAQTSHWITADHASCNAPNTWIEFRKTLILAESPQEACAHIAADTKYWLGALHGFALLRQCSLNRSQTTIIPRFPCLLIFLTIFVHNKIMNL